MADPDRAARPSTLERSSATPPAAPGERALPVPRRNAELAEVPAPPGEESGFVIAVLGGATRKGPWEPPARLWGLALMGGVDIDFREADLLEGTTEVTLLALMGGVKVVVPPDVDVEVNGIGLMGGFSHQQHRASGTDAPRIRINGLALMGGVDVKVKS